MTITASPFARLVAAAAIACGIAVTAAPALAQTMPDMPTLSFPTKDGQWGCKLMGSCAIVKPAPLSWRFFFF